MSEDRSTTVQGNEFRDRVKRLLELTPGCTNVQSEYLIGTQPVDLYYEERTSFRVMRVACECKDYGRPLTKDLLASHIYPRYAPLLRNNLVDAVRVIAPLELGATARAYLLQECGFSFHTIDQLETEIIDFRQYLRTLTAGFTEDGLDQYYVRPLLDTGEDLESRIEAWISADSSQPIAILAGYGMGKTSFARRLAYRLAERALVDPRARIPILIPLSEISSEQTLEGLLGKLLAAQHRIPGYHFSPFSELNRRGRFVMILDGFDEMKHTISWPEFKHNFGELNRLNGANARVILLGRPSALLSDDEELYVLRGKRRTGNQIFTVSGAPEYQQLRLAEFSAQQALAFIRQYASYRVRMSLAIRAPDLGALDVEPRIQGLESDPEMLALVLRPVQAKMLADLAIDPEVTWRSFTRYELYQEFIGRITEREARKPTRSVFHQEVRLTFIRKVAWWLWRRSSSAGFNLAELPDSVLHPIPGDIVASTEGVRRDLVAGSLLEKKAGENYYFPHRSFLEFLVAQFICMEDPDGINEISAALTPEVISFIKESNHEHTVAGWIADVEPEVEGPISIESLALIAWGLNRTDAGETRRIQPDANPYHVMIGYLRLLERKEPLNVVANFLSRGFITVESTQARLASLVGLLLIQEAADDELRAGIRKRILAFLLVECLDEMKRLLSQDRHDALAVDKRNPFVRILLASFVPPQNEQQGSFAISLHAESLLATIQHVMAPRWQLANVTGALMSEFSSVPLSELVAFDKRLALSAEGAYITSFFRRFPQPSTLIPVTQKKAKWTLQ